MCACIKCWCSGFGRVRARALLLGSGARVGDEWEPGVWRTSCITTDARTGAIMGMVAGAKAMALDERASIFRSEGECNRVRLQVDRESGGSFATLQGRRRDCVHFRVNYAFLR